LRPIRVLGACCGGIAALVVARRSHQYRTSTRTLPADAPHHFSAPLPAFAHRPTFQHPAGRNHPYTDVLKQTVFVIVDSCKH
jgi:hypothetical protein